MKTLKLLSVVVLAAGLAACEKKTTEPKPPVPKAEPGAASAQVGVSTESQLGVVLNAPGNYLRNTVGHVGEARNAAALYNKTVDESMAMDPSKKTN